MTSSPPKLSCMLNDDVRLMRNVSVFKLIARGRPWMCQRCTFRRSSTISSENTTGRRHKERLPNSPARTRFAPSPTGYLHLGSLRTALFNYLIAKATGGQFILRLEDTDRKRVVSDSEKRLYEDLRWAGLQWDEGPEVGGPHGPYRQSERTDLYKTEALKLVQHRHAYRCFCSQDKLQATAEKRRLEGFWTEYDRTCFALSSGESENRAAKGEAYVVRLKTPDRPPFFTDLVYGQFAGNSTAKTGNYEDPILLKTDGHPTYHLANVVDDHYMEISHVIRATEWLGSTPKHITLYKAFGWQPPVYAHVGLLRDKDKKKLSKRTASDTVDMFRETGYLPEALINYLALMGWSHSLTNDCMTMEHLIQNFDFKFTKGDVNVALEKLNYLQVEHAKRHAANKDHQFEVMVKAVQGEALQTLQNRPERRTKSDNELEPTVRELLSKYTQFYTDPKAFLMRHLDFFCDRDRDRFERRFLHPNVLANLQQIKERIEAVSPNQWNSDTLQEQLSGLMETLQSESSEDTKTRPFRRCFQYYLRWALLGGRPGPNLPDTMVFLGRERTLMRLVSAARTIFRKEYESEENLEWISKIKRPPED